MTLWHVLRLLRLCRVLTYLTLCLWILITSIDTLIMQLVLLILLRIWLMPVLILLMLFFHFSMCHTPLLIPNPYYKYRRGSSIEDKITENVLNNSKYKHFHDRLNQYIQVPCGRCSACVSNRQGFFNQRIQMESLRSYLFYFTLTYNSLVPTIQVGEYNLMFPDFVDVQNMFKRLRNSGYSFRYWVVSEYGKKGRPHYHGILALEKSSFPKDLDISVIEKRWYKLLLNEWRINVGSKRMPVYLPLLDYIRKGNKCTYDFHYIEPIKDHDNDVSFYVSKYLMKANERIEKLLCKIKLDKNLDSDLTSVMLKLLKPRSVMSKDFGLVSKKHVEQGVHDFVKDYIVKNLSYFKDIPQFADINTGSSMMLAPIYKRYVPIEYRQSQFERLSTSEESFNLPESTGDNHRNKCQRILENQRKFAINRKKVLERQED